MFKFKVEFNFSINYTQYAINLNILVLQIQYFA